VTSLEVPVFNALSSVLGRFIASKGHARWHGTIDIFDLVVNSVFYRLRVFVYIQAIKSDNTINPEKILLTNKK